MRTNHDIELARTCSYKRMANAQAILIYQSHVGHELDIIKCFTENKIKSKTVILHIII